MQSTRGPKAIQVYARTQEYMLELPGGRAAALGGRRLNTTVRHGRSSITTLTNFSFLLCFVLAPELNVTYPRIRPQSKRPCGLWMQQGHILDFGVRCGAHI